MISITVLSSYILSLICDLLEIIKTIVLLSFTIFAPQKPGIRYINILHPVFRRETEGCFALISPLEIP